MHHQVVYVSGSRKGLGVACGDGTGLGSTAPGTQKKGTRCGGGMGRGGCQQDPPTTSVEGRSIGDGGACGVSFGHLAWLVCHGLHRVPLEGGGSMGGVGRLLPAPPCPTPVVLKLWTEVSWARKWARKCIRPETTSRRTVCCTMGAEENDAKSLQGKGGQGYGYQYGRLKSHNPRKRLWTSFL